MTEDQQRQKKLDSGKWIKKTSINEIENVLVIVENGTV